MKSGAWLTDFVGNHKGARESNPDLSRGIGAAANLDKADRLGNHGADRGLFFCPFVWLRILRRAVIL